MSNKRSRLNDLVSHIRRQSAADQLGLVPERWPYASTVIMTDDGLDALAVASLSPRAAALRRAQELADYTQESYHVFENADGSFRTVREEAEWPTGEWGRIETVRPR
jgi:hypothetical protein